MPELNGPSSVGVPSRGGVVPSRRAFVNRAGKLLFVAAMVDFIGVAQATPPPCGSSGHKDANCNGAQGANGQYHSQDSDCGSGAYNDQDSGCGQPTPPPGTGSNSDSSCNSLNHTTDGNVGPP